VVVLIKSVVTANEVTVGVLAVVQTVAVRIETIEAAPHSRLTVLGRGLGRRTRRVVARRAIVSVRGRSLASFEESRTCRLTSALLHAHQVLISAEVLRFLRTTGACSVPSVIVCVR
jgi:hypothetical protein